MPVGSQYLPSLLRQTYSYSLSSIEILFQTKCLLYSKINLVLGMSLTFFLLSWEVIDAISCSYVHSSLNNVKVERNDAVDSMLLKIQREGGMSYEDLYVFISCCAVFSLCSLSSILPSIRSGTELADLLPHAPSRRFCADSDMASFLLQNKNVFVPDMPMSSDNTASPVRRSAALNHAGHNNENLPMASMSRDAIEAARFSHALRRHKTLTMEDFGDVLMGEPTTSATVPLKRPASSAVDDSDEDFDSDFDSSDDDSDEDTSIVAEPPRPTNRWSSRATAGADLVFPTYISEPIEVTVSEAQRAQMGLGPADSAYNHNVVGEPIIDDTFGSFRNDPSVEARNTPTYPGYALAMGLAQIGQLPESPSHFRHYRPESFAPPVTKEIRTVAPQTLTLRQVFSEPAIE